MDDNSFSSSEKEYFINNNIIVNSKEIYITSYDTSCGPDVVIPRQIDNFPITMIASSKCYTYYDTYGYFKNTNIENLILQDNITKICAGGLAWIGLKTVEIPDSVKNMYENSFSYNQLKTVEIPNGITSLYGVFENNELIDVKIPNSVTTIDDSAFGNNQLTSVVIPDSVTTIGWDAFSNNQLTNVEIPNSVTTIGDDAFRNNQLETVTIGSGIQYIKESAFEKNETSNPNLESITFTSKTCEEIKNIVASEGSTTKYFPWLYFSSPYYLEGYKASIFGTDGECIY